MPVNGESARFHLVPVVLALGLAGSLAAASNKLAPDIAQDRGGDSIDVIVQFFEPPTAEHHNRVSQRGGRFKRALTPINGALYAVPASRLKELSEDPAVKYVSPDRSLKASLDYGTPTLGLDVARSQGLNGKGIGIAVIDSGVAAVNDLKSRVVYQQNFVAGKSSACDEYGHGTHVAGIAAGNATDSTCSTCSRSFMGGAPLANLVNLRVLNESGAGTDSAVIAAIDTAIKLKTKYNIRVINLSLGRGVFESYTMDPLCQAAERAWKAGIVVVTSAGNYGRDNSMKTEGYATITSPGNDPYVITVGAMKTMSSVSRADDLMATYSSKGPTLIDRIVKPDLVAPGNRVISLANSASLLYKAFPANLVPIQYYSNNPIQDSKSYFRLSGTSMAAPEVSAAAALLIQQKPAITPDEVKARLMKTATRAFPLYSTYTDPMTGRTYFTQYDIFTVGAGYLDAWAALNSTEPAVGAALSPSVKLNKNGTISLVAATGTVWNSNSNWSAGIVWGSGLISGTSTVWGSGVVWGTSGSPEGTGVVWGTGVTWGLQTTAAEILDVAIRGEN